MQRRPQDLNPAGQRAWKRALAHVEARDGDPDTLFDQLCLYARAVDRSSRANEAWRKAGRALTVKNPNGASGEHPLLKAVDAADRAVWRYGRALGLTVPGATARLGRPTRAEERKRKAARPSRRREDPRLKLLDGNAGG